MSNKSSTSDASSYQAIGDYWDTHDATECGEEDAADFEVNIRSQGHYFPVDGQIYLKIRKFADQRGISEETLLNIFLKERIDQLESGQRA
jgi:hypothetical protein